jgi:hypothetical protein
VIKTAAKVVVLGVAVAATAEFLRRTGVIEKAVTKVQDFAGDVMLKAFQVVAEDNTEDATDVDPMERMYR